MHRPADIKAVKNKRKTMAVIHAPALVHGGIFYLNQEARKKFNYRDKRNSENIARTNNSREKKMTTTPACYIIPPTGAGVGSWGTAGVASLACWRILALRLPPSLDVFRSFCRTTGFFSSSSEKVLRSFIPSSPEGAGVKLCLSPFKAPIMV